MLVKEVGGKGVEVRWEWSGDRGNLEVVYLGMR